MDQKIQDKPEVSIITPAYNAEPYVAETIESVIKQTFQRWEMIIVDDGSIDRTGEIVKAYMFKDKRISYYRLESNSGRPAVPRNYAIEKSLGDYLAFLDADDLWLPGKLEYQLSYMKQNALDFSYGPTQSTTGKNDVAYEKLKENRDLLKDSYIACLTVMLKNRREYRPIFDEEPFLKAAEDSYAWIQMCKKTNRIDCYGHYLSIYRDNSKGSILSDYHFDPQKRLAKQLLYYSKLQLTNTITAQEALFCYLRALCSNVMTSMRRSLFLWLKKKYIHFNC